MTQPAFLLVIAALVVLAATGFCLYLRWGTRWGSQATERTAAMPGDVYLEGGPGARVIMTRAISIRARPQAVWPWLAQLGRGAGWYSIDRLDNGGKDSARHIVSWIPEPCIGDASAIGYLRHIEPGQALVWWVDGVKFAGATARLVTDIQLTRDGDRSRLVIRMSADADGTMAPIALLVFKFIDSIMARAQLIEIKHRVELYGTRLANPDEPETGAKDQYQLYEVLYASGGQAGVPGSDGAARVIESAPLPPDRDPGGRSIAHPADESTYLGPIR